MPSSAAGVGTAGSSAHPVDGMQDAATLPSGQGCTAIAVWGTHRAAGLPYGRRAPLLEAQGLQGRRVECPCDPQPFALLIVTERRARARTEPPIQGARRHARRL